MVAIALLQHVSNVRDWRAALAEKAALLKAQKEEFALKISSLDAEVRLLAEQTDGAEKILKGAALAHYNMYHDKNPCPGVEIKDFNVVTYDATKAFEWAKTSGVAIIPEQLDTKAFEKIASATSLPFVTKKKEPQAQISKDLGKAIAVAQATDATVAAALATPSTPAAVSAPARDTADDALPWEVTGGDKE